MVGLASNIVYVVMRFVTILEYGVEPLGFLSNKMFLDDIR